MNILVNARMALLSLLLTSAACLDVMTNRSDSRQDDCKDLLCDTRKSYKSTRLMLCIKNESDITIWLKENEGAYDGVLVLYNKTGCEVSRLRETKSREITESCNATLPNDSCSVRKELYIEIRVVHNRGKISRDREEQNKSLSRFERGFKISFKSQIRSIKQNSVFIVIRGNANGSVSALVCLVLDKCRSQPDICTCSVQQVFTNPAPATFGTNTTNGSRSKPRVSEEGRNNRKAMKHTSAVFCFVLLCLLLEILVCVVLHLWLSEKRRRTYSLEIEPSTSNPSYQPGLQLLPSSNSPPLPDTGQEIYQPPYQPLVENTRVPGMSTGYRELKVERGEAPKVSAVDPAFYQDLVQNEKRENMNQGNTVQGEEVEEPLYYVLEEPAPIKEVPRSPRQGFDSSESLRDPLYYVLKELMSQINANGPNRASSEDSVEEPICYVLENPREIEEKNTQNEKS